MTTIKQSELLKAVTKDHAAKIVLKEAPPEYEFLADPPSISAFDLDVVKLTAQFVARNGRQFLTNLMNREQRNFQFDFLRPQHSLFQYFTKLLEQYTKVLIPPKDLKDKLNFEADNRAHVLEQVSYRVAWLEHQEAARRKQEEALEKERVSYAQVDWHNFVVVETVDYQPWEVGWLVVLKRERKLIQTAGGELPSPHKPGGGGGAGADPAAPGGGGGRRAGAGAARRGLRLGGGGDRCGHQRAGHGGGQQRGGGAA